MNDIDEILASGRYTDRRGKEWVKHTYLHGSAEWLHFVTGGTYACIPDQMRLLIERDKHRDVCEGLWACSKHPVPAVTLSRMHRPRVYVDEEPYTRFSEAMDAARASAVGE